MSVTINTNVNSLFAQASLSKSQGSLAVSLQRLSSGLRINSAKDDATGLSIATGYDSQIRGANQAIINANDGISKSQINDGYTAQITENLQRIRELYVQAGNTPPTGDGALEVSALQTENTRINGLITAVPATVIAADGSTYAPTGAAPSVAASYADISAIDTDIAAVTTARAQFGADIATFQSAINNLQSASVNLSAAKSRVLDTDYAAETANLTKNQILQQAGTAILAQSNQLPNSVLTLLK